MKLHKILLLMVASVMSLSLSAHTLRSPQDVLQLEVGVNQNGTPVYELRRGEKTILRPSTLGIEIKGGKHFTEGFEIDTVTYSTFDEVWTPVWGEQATIRNHYNEMAVRLYQPATQRTMVLRFRLYDDGLGFRYEF
ncbi:MAG: glycoside hydrolase family 97 N-terminal domain-containing protein, partial [Rikenellaceae bacterium]|nr:glycoside hydrolase family 97 N-terminal domain-containing protein [Rikenellaceae bacterium]